MEALLFMSRDVPRLTEQRADCAETGQKKHQAPCQGLEGINPSNGAGDGPGQEAVPRSDNALLISLSRVHNERKVSSETEGKKLKGKVLVPSNTLGRPVYNLSCVCTSAG